MIKAKTFIALLAASASAGAGLIFPENSKTPANIQKLVEQKVSERCPRMLAGNEIRVTNESKNRQEYETHYLIEMKGLNNGLGDPEYDMEVEVLDYLYNRTIPSVRFRNYGDCF